MAPVPCPRCGASGEGFVCAYCGAALLEPGDERAELAALDQYHKHLEAAAPSPEQCSRLIAKGYVPAGTKALVEAGMRCLPHVDPSTTDDGCREQWLSRLDLISTRLKVTGGAPGEKAAAEFAEKARLFREKDAADTKQGCGCLALLAAILIAVAWWLTKRLGF